MLATFRQIPTPVPGADGRRATAEDTAGTQTSNRLSLVVLDLAALRARVVVKLPHCGVESLTQRNVHVLLSRRAIHYEFLARDPKLDVDLEALALLLLLVRQPDGHAAAGDLRMKALQLCHLVTDMRFHGLRMVDSVKQYLQRFDHG
jgi:hypothetical protein